MQIGLHCGRKWDRVAASEPGWRGSSHSSTSARVFNFASTIVASFRGTFEQKLDAKNRLTLPVKYRSALAEGALLAMPLDQKPCVAIWLPGEYDAYTQRAIEELPPLSPRRAALERFFFGKSQLVELDGVGRIMLPT